MWNPISLAGKVERTREQLSSQGKGGPGALQGATSQQNRNEVVISSFTMWDEKCKLNVGICPLLFPLGW